MENKEEDIIDLRDTIVGEYNKRRGKAIHRDGYPIWSVTSATQFNDWLTNYLKDNWEIKKKV
jgi:hypothetical protein